MTTPTGLANMEGPDVVDRLLDLIKQATHERSHYYVAACARAAVIEIGLLRAKVVNMTMKGMSDIPADTAGRPMTLGEQRVRLGFNPSKDSLVDQIKVKSADLIDLCEQIKKDIPGNEAGRLCSLAQTHYEDAAMWAVKAATTGK